MGGGLSECVLTGHIRRGVTEVSHRGVARETELGLKQRMLLVLLLKNQTTEHLQPSGASQGPGPTCLVQRILSNILAQRGPSGCFFFKAICFCSPQPPPGATPNGISPSGIITPRILPSRAVPAAGRGHFSAGEPLECVMQIHCPSPLPPHLS